MKENLLDYWTSESKKYIWRHALINVAPFSDINKIRDNLEFFFGRQKFEYDLNYAVPDQMFSLLLSPKLSSIYKLAEISNTIDYYKNKSGFALLSIHGKKRRLSLDEIQGKYFELFINKILCDNNLNSDVTDHYLDSNNQIHPIDISFEFNNKKYLVECLKITNPQKNLYIKLGNEINKIAKKYANKLRGVEMYSGYYIFNIDQITPQVVQDAVSVFKIGIDKYYSNLSQVEKIPLDHQYDNEYFQFKIFSKFVSSSFNFNQISNLNKNYLSFNTMLIKGPNKVLLNFKTGIHHQNINAFIIDKIRAKKRQHKNSPIQDKLILVEFEKIDDNSLYQGSLPITQNEVNSIDFTKVIDHNTTVVFWIKTIKSDIYKTDIGIIDHPNFDKGLKSRLLNLKINWC